MMRKEKKSQNNNSMKTDEIMQKTKGLANYKARSTMQRRSLRVVLQDNQHLSIIASKQPHGPSRGVTCQRKGCPDYYCVGLPLTICTAFLSFIIMTCLVNFDGRR
jgi:hypothetical protein